jgi:hypothetical protein
MQSINTKITQNKSEKANEKGERGRMLHNLDISLSFANSFLLPYPLSLITHCTDLTVKSQDVNKWLDGAAVKTHPQKIYLTII